MEKAVAWGQLGELIFEGHWIPKSGTFTETKTARFRQIEVLNDKNSKQPMGMELTTFSFTVEIPEYPFLQRKTSGAERALRYSGVGNIGETFFGEISDLDLYDGLMGNSARFGDALERMQDYQKSYVFAIGDVYKGMYNIISIRKNYYFRPDGNVKMAVFDIQLEEDIAEE